MNDVPLFGKDMSQAIMGRRLVAFVLALAVACPIEMVDGVMASLLTVKSDRACSKSWSESVFIANDAVIRATMDAHRAASTIACPSDKVNLEDRSFSGNVGDKGQCRRRNGDTKADGDRGQAFKGDCELDLSRAGESGLLIVMQVEGACYVQSAWCNDVRNHSVARQERIEMSALISRTISCSFASEKHFIDSHGWISTSAACTGLQRCQSA